MKRLILDCDMGTDDALALLILLRAEQQELVKTEAICCGMGNTSLENVCKNVIRLLEITRRTDIPVYKGSPGPLIRSPELMATYRGGDGFGGVPFENPPDLNLIEKDPSALAMCNIAQRYKNDIYLIAIGPLTNVALAMKVQPDFTGYLKEIYVMGGNHKGIGDVTNPLEYNFQVDPEAVHIVLNEAKCPVTILPFETCVAPKISRDWRWNVFGKLDNKAIQLLTKAEEKKYADKSILYWRSCDSLLAAAFVRPDLVVSSETFHATIELHGHETRGQLILGHKKNEKDNVTIITGIDREEYKKLLLDLSML